MNLFKFRRSLVVIPGVKAHGPCLQEDELIFLINGPFDVLGVLVMVLDFNRPGRNLPYLIAGQAGNILHRLGDILRMRLHAVVRAGENDAGQLGGDGFVGDLHGCP